MSDTVKVRIAGPAGTGKSVLALIIAEALATHGLRIGVIDDNSQASPDLNPIDTQKRGNITWWGYEDTLVNVHDRREHVMKYLRDRGLEVVVQTVQTQSKLPVFSEQELLKARLQAAEARGKLMHELLVLLFSKHVVRAVLQHTMSIEDLDAMNRAGLELGIFGAREQTVEGT